MRVLYIYDGDWPRGATRVRKETLSLFEAGHEILLIARNESSSPRFAREPWMNVQRLPAIPSRVLNKAINFPFPANPVWGCSIAKACRTFRPQVLLVEDLPLAPVAIALGDLLSIPVVYDMGEVYPEFLRGLRSFKRLSLVDRLIRRPGPAEILESFVLRRAARTLVVSEESKARAIERGAPADRVAIVGNTPEDLDSLSRPQPCPAPLKGHADRLIALFVGVLISDRGIAVAVDAIDILRETLPEVLLVLVGDGLERSAIEAQVRKRHLESHVLLTGWEDHELLPGYYQHAHVGLLPFLDGGQIRFTLANKLFDYMGAGLPVVASDVPPMRRVLLEAPAGALVKAGDPQALAEGIRSVLAAERQTRVAMGRAGRALVEGKYHWREDARRLAEAVRQAASHVR